MKTLSESAAQPPSDEANRQTVPEYGRHNPRRSGRNRKPRHRGNVHPKILTSSSNQCLLYKQSSARMMYLKHL